jgi:hypothetical protein
MADKFITEEAYISYFTDLATKHKTIQHTINGRQSFFFIPVEMDLKEIDNAIRDKKSTPMMALDAMRGTFDEGQSARYLQTVNGQFTILETAKVGLQTDIRRAQDVCLKIGLQILARMKVDLRGQGMVPGTFFSIGNVRYDQVGPMAVNHYGYTFRFNITCPFSFSVDAGNWTDK